MFDLILIFRFRVVLVSKVFKTRFLQQGSLTPSEPLIMPTHSPRLSLRCVNANLESCDHHWWSLMVATANANLGSWWPSLLHGKSERNTYITCLITGLSDFPPQSSLATGCPEYIQYEVVAQNNVSLSLSNTCSVQTLPMRLSLGQNRFCPTMFLFSHQALHWVDYIALSRGKNLAEGLSSEQTFTSSTEELNLFHRKQASETGMGGFHNWTL